MSLNQINEANLGWKAANYEKLKGKTIKELDDMIKFYTDEVKSLPIMEEIKVEKPQEESKEQEVKPIQPKKRKVRIIKTNTTEKE